MRKAAWVSTASTSTSSSIGTSTGAIRDHCAEPEVSSRPSTKISRIARTRSSSPGSPEARRTSAPLLARFRRGGDEARSERSEAEEEAAELAGNRWAVVGFGVVVIVVSCLLQNVVAALTLAYGILVGGLLVPILGGLVWPRATRLGALAAMAVGTLATLGTMLALGGLEANAAIFAGLAAGLVVFVVTLLTPPVADDVRTEWDRRHADPGIDAHSTINS